MLPQSSTRREFTARDRHRIVPHQQVSDGRASRPSETCLSLDRLEMLDHADDMSVELLVPNCRLTPYGRVVRYLTEPLYLKFSYVSSSETTSALRKHQ